MSTMAVVNGAVLPTMEIPPEFPTWRVLVTART